MRELYLSELRRFRNAALLAAPLHLLALFLVLRFCDLVHMHAHRQLLVMFIQLLLVFGFGLYQFGTYRQPNRWMWLMHRPVPASRIAAAICAASATLVALVIGLPGLLALAGTQLLTTRVVDAYHYAVVLHGTLFAMAAWLCAGYVMLNRSKLGAAIVLLPFLLQFYITSVYQLLLLDALSIFLLAAMVATTMQPNRHAAPRGAGPVLATALPLLLAAYFLLSWGGSMAYQYAAILLGAHPLNTEVPPAGGYTQAVRSTPDQLLQLGLATSRHPRAAEWRAAIGAENSVASPVYLDRYPIRNQVGPLTPHGFSDPANKLDWTYSQDAAGFIGRNAFTGERKAFLAVPSLPLVEQDEAGRVSAMFPHSQAVYDAASRSWREVLRVPSDEVLLGTPARAAQGRHYLVTSKRLLVLEDSPQRRELFSIPLPGPAADLASVDIATVTDGLLASFVFGKRMIDGAPGGEQLTLFIGAGGQAMEVARRPLTHDFPTLFEHKDWWISPVLHALDSVPGRLLANPGVFPPLPLTLPRPPAAWIAAVLAAVLSALAAWWWQRRTDASQRLRAGWVMACLLLGPAAFLCLAVMQPRRARLTARLRGSTPAAA
ncbi:hypothetical protein GTP41_18200 [Pseudoduganella sp. DS3]|uniref:Uncharacterized protein n=1 Tax=Pseudoduganella guangdongensis TaxID=2692179 RepID=A0A6N9HK69_9BURK|nr:hypothetical protein [Pseudoduganella guangdongensis]MYN04028.1 hypothetical protein [Pseudoduganella guangdongensis]